MPCSAQERPQYLYHFVLHAALDAVEEQEWRTTAMHLGVVDRFNNLQAGRVVGGGGREPLYARQPQGRLAAAGHRVCPLWRATRAALRRRACCAEPPATPGTPRRPAQVSAFTTAARAKFLLLHDGRSDDLVKSFFRDVYELYLRVSWRTD